MTIFLKYLQYLHVMENDKHILIQVSTLLTLQMLGAFHFEFKCCFLQVSKVESNNCSKARIMFVISSKTYDIHSPSRFIFQYTQTLPSDFLFSFYFCSYFSKLIISCFILLKNKNIYVSVHILVIKTKLAQQQKGQLYPQERYIHFTIAQHCSFVAAGQKLQRKEQSFHLHTHRQNSLL